MATAPSRVSAIIVAHDADQLEKTVGEAREIAAEAIVVSGGIDEPAIRTVARAAGASSYESHWPESLAVAMNRGLERASGDWLLWLEDGETIPEGTRQRLSTLDHQGPGLGRVYYVPVQASAADGELAEQRAEIRLVPRRPGLRFAGRVRPGLHESIAALGLDVDSLPWTLYGNYRQPQCDRFERIARRDLLLCDLETKQLGARAGIENQLGQAWHLLGEPAEAESAYRRGLELAAADSDERLEAWHALIGLGEASPPGERIRACLQALEDFPVDMPLLCATGALLQQAEQTRLALRSYATAFRYGQIRPALWHPVDLRDTAARHYAMLLKVEQRGGEALKVLRTAYDEGLCSAALCRQLLEAMVERGEVHDALAMVDKVETSSGSQAAFRAAIRGACLAGQRNWIAARAYLTTAFSAGCRDVVCLRALTSCYLALGDLNQARSTVDTWQSICPADPEPQLYRHAIDSPGAFLQVDDSRRLRVDTRDADPSRPATDARSPSSLVKNRPEGRAVE